jgi:transposase-like protein
MMTTGASLPVHAGYDVKATSISLLVATGVCADGQKVLLAVKNMGGESTEAWRAVLDDLIKRGLQRPEFLIVDGALGLETAKPRAARELGALIKPHRSA